MANQDAGMHLSSAQVLYTDSTVTITIPDGNLVHDVVIEVTTAFAGTSPTLSVGYTGTTTAFHNAVVSTSTGVKAAMTTTNQYRMGTSEDVVVTVGGTSLTAGKAIVYVLHSSSVAAA